MRESLTVLEDRGLLRRLDAPLRARRDETELQALMALLQRRQGPGLLLGGVEGINLQDSRTWSSCRWTARPNRALNPA